MAAGFDQLIQQTWEWVLAAFAASVTGIGGLLSRDHKRLNTLERQVQGDDDDPNAKGLLTIAHDTRERQEDVIDRVDNLEQKMDHHHQELMERLPSDREE